MGSFSGAKHCQTESEISQNHSARRIAPGAFVPARYITMSTQSRQPKNSAVGGKKIGGQYAPTHRTELPDISDDDAFEASPSETLERKPLTGWHETIHFERPASGDTGDFNAERDKIVAAIKKSEWFTRESTDEFSPLSIWVSQLENSKTADDMDDSLDIIYDLADNDRVLLR